MSAARRPRAAAVPGSAAWVVWTFLCRQRIQEWLPGVLPNLRAGEQAELTEALRDLEELAGEYKAWLASDLGSSELPAAEPVAPLSHEISVREAAEVLRVSGRRVRQLCADGTLEARRDNGWAWLIDRASVELYRRDRAA